MATLVSRPRAATDHWLRLKAQEQLRAEGLRRVKPYRVERQAPDIWWAAYTRRGRAWTAILAGTSPQDWQLHGTIEGWPVGRWDARGPRAIF